MYTATDTILEKFVLKQRQNPTPHIEMKVCSFAIGAVLLTISPFLKKGLAKSLAGFEPNKELYHCSGSASFPQGHSNKVRNIHPKQAP